jgi:hypothetical protein
MNGDQGFFLEDSIKGLTPIVGEIISEQGDGNNRYVFIRGAGRRLYVHATFPAPAFLGPAPIQKLVPFSNIGDLRRAIPSAFGFWAFEATAEALLAMDS